MGQTGGVEPLRWMDPPDGPAVALLDQTRLPNEEVTLVCRDVPALVAAIKSLAVRGAPLLGIAGGYGVALAAAVGAGVPAAVGELAGARPAARARRWPSSSLLTGPAGSSSSGWMRPARSCRARGSRRTRRGGTACRTRCSPTTRRAACSPPARSTWWWSAPAPGLIQK